MLHFCLFVVVIADLYIDKTKRSMKRRMTEHRYAVKKMDVQNGIAVHVQRHQHSINRESARVCATAKGY